jgi:hypothetical protein
MSKESSAKPKYDTPILILLGPLSQGQGQATCRTGSNPSGKCFNGNNANGGGNTCRAGGVAHSNSSPCRNGTIASGGGTTSCATGTTPSA